MSEFDSSRRSRGRSNTGSGGEVAADGDMRSRLLYRRMIQRKAARQAAPAPAGPSREPPAGSAGAPLPENLKRTMESRFGADFSAVRIHTGAEADASTRAVGARAYASGNDLFFAAGAYDPESRSGQELIAHELTHVVQQRGATSAAVQGKAAVSDPSDAAEVEADRVAAQVVDGGKAEVKATPSAPLHRSPDGPVDAGVAGGVEPAGTGSLVPPASPAVPAAAVAVGNVDYYFNRNHDFIRRHPLPPPSPPDYYMNYGNKYAHRFTEVLKPKLSDSGKKWVDLTFVLLQQKIENLRIANAITFDTFEQRNDEFRSYAYGTHPACYLAGGLHNLPPSDLFRIATTPDLGDILNYDGIKQIIIVAIGIIPEWGHDMGSWAEAKAKKAGHMVAKGADTAEEWGSEKAHQAADLGRRAWHRITD